MKKSDSGIKDLSLHFFLARATQPVQYDVIFRRLITNYSELLIFQFVREGESYITESDMVQMKIYTFKKERLRHGKKTLEIISWMYVLQVTYGNEFIFFSVYEERRKKREEDSIMDFW